MDRSRTLYRRRQYRTSRRLDCRQNGKEPAARQPRHVDREKRRIYARAGIPEYWIINLVNAQVEVFQTPRGSGPDADYEHQQVLTRTDLLTLSLPGAATQSIPVAGLVP